MFTLYEVKKFNYTVMKTIQDYYACDPGGSEDILYIYIYICVCVCVCVFNNTCKSYLIYLFDIYIIELLKKSSKV